MNRGKSIEEKRNMFVIGDKFGWMLNDRQSIWRYEGWRDMMMYLKKGRQGYYPLKEWEEEMNWKSGTEIWREDLSEFIEFEMIRRKLRAIGGIHRFAHCNELFDERIKGFLVYLLNLTPIHKERYRFTSISLCMKNKISIVIREIYFCFSTSIYYFRMMMISKFIWGQKSQINYGCCRRWKEIYNI